MQTQCYFECTYLTGTTATTPFNQCALRCMAFCLQSCSQYRSFAFQWRNARPMRNAMHIQWWNPKYGLIRDVINWKIYCARHLYWKNAPLNAIFVLFNQNWLSRIGDGLKSLLANTQSIAPRAMSCTFNNIDKAIFGELDVRRLKVAQLANARNEKWQNGKTFNQHSPNGGIVLYAWLNFTTLSGIFDDENIPPHGGLPWFYHRMCFLGSTEFNRWQTGNRKIRRAWIFVPIF